MKSPLVHIENFMPQCRSLPGEGNLPALFQNPKKRKSLDLVSIGSPEMGASQQVFSSLEYRGNNRKRQLSSTVPSSHSRRRLQKSVHFEVDSNDAVVTRVQNCPAGYIVTEEEEKNMWWDREEISEFKRRSRNASKIYKGEEYTRKFLEAWEACCNNDSCHLESIPFLSKTPARGLEMYMFPVEMVKRRQQIIRMVLNAQSKMPPSMSAENRAQLLNVVSKRLTRPVRRLCRVLAIADAKVVAQLL